MSSLSRAAAAYTGQLRDFLQHEFSAEVAAVKTRLREWPRAKLQREGLSVFDLVPRQMGVFHGWPILRLYPQNGGELPYHRLVFGDVVIISRDNPLSNSAGSGVVLNKSDKWINIAVRKAPQGRQGLELTDSNAKSGADGKTPALPLLRIDSGWNEVAFERMEAALRTIAACDSTGSVRPSWLLPLLLEHSLAATEGITADPLQSKRRRGKSAIVAAARDLAATKDLLQDEIDDGMLTLADAEDAAVVESQLTSAMASFRRPVLPTGAMPVLAHLVPKYWSQRSERLAARSRLHLQLKALTHGSEPASAAAANGAPNGQKPETSDPVEQRFVSQWKDNTGTAFAYYPTATSTNSVSTSSASSTPSSSPASTSIVAAPPPLDMSPEEEAERVVSTGLQVARLQRTWMQRFAQGAYHSLLSQQSSADAEGVASSSSMATNGARWFVPTGLSSLAATHNLPEHLRRDGGGISSRGSSRFGADENDDWSGYDGVLEGDYDPFPDRRKSIRYRGDDASSSSRRGADGGAGQKEDLLAPEILTFRMPSSSSLSTSDLQAVLSSLDHLNASQRAAIVVGLTSKVTCLQGPPGTGKTRTAAHLVASWRDVQRRRAQAGQLKPLPQHQLQHQQKAASHKPQRSYGSDVSTSSSSPFLTDVRQAEVDAAIAEVDALHGPRIQPGGPVLAVASSNVAVDQLLENFLALGLRAVRVGDVVRVRPELRSASVEAAVAAHPAMEVVRRLLAEAEELTTRLARITGASSSSSGRGNASNIRYVDRKIINRTRHPFPAFASASDGGSVAHYSVLTSGSSSSVSSRRLLTAYSSSSASSPSTALAPMSVRYASTAFSAGAEDFPRTYPAELRRSGTTNLISTFRAYAQGLKKSELSVAGLRLMRTGIQEMLARAGRIERELAARVVREADVICATATGAGHELLKGIGVNLLIVDEASQIREPELLVPLCRLGSNEAQLVLIGDDRQLPPVVHSPRSLPLQISLFERLLKTALPSEAEGSARLFTSSSNSNGSASVSSSSAAAESSPDASSTSAAATDAATAAAAAARHELADRIRAAELRALAFAFGRPGSDASIGTGSGAAAGGINPSLLEALGIATSANSGTTAAVHSGSPVSALEAFFRPVGERVEGLALAAATSADSVSPFSSSSVMPSSASAALLRPSALPSPASADAPLPSADSLRCIPVARCMLTLGYRMHPAIAAWPNWALYGSRIKDAYAHALAQRQLSSSSAEESSSEPSSSGALLPPLRHPPPGFPWPYNLPACFIPVTDGQEGQQEDNKSKYNLKEAQAVVRVVRALLRWRPGREKASTGDDDDKVAADADIRGTNTSTSVEDTSGNRPRRPLRASDIGIIAPYAAQVRLISELLRKEGLSVAEGSNHLRDDDELNEIDSGSEDDEADDAQPADASDDDSDGREGDAAAGEARSDTSQPLPSAVKAARKASKARALAYADNVEHGRQMTEEKDAAAPGTASPESSVLALASPAPRKPPSAAAAARSSIIEVRSVDGFQGREKQVMIVSATRSNESGAVGFLADYRRLNVALTRARTGLIVVGDNGTLAHDEVWSSWLRFIVLNDLVVPLAMVPRR